MARATTTAARHHDSDDELELDPLLESKPEPPRLSLSHVCADVRVRRLRGSESLRPGHPPADRRAW